MAQVSERHRQHLFMCPVGSAFETRDSVMANTRKQTVKYNDYCNGFWEGQPREDVMKHRETRTERLSLIQHDD